MVSSREHPTTTTATHTHTHATHARAHMHRRQAHAGRSPRRAATRTCLLRATAGLLQRSRAGGGGGVRVGGGEGRLPPQRLTMDALFSSSSCAAAAWPLATATCSGAAPTATSAVAAGVLGDAACLCVSDVHGCAPFRDTRPLRWHLHGLGVVCALSADSEPWAPPPPAAPPGPPPCARTPRPRRHSITGVCPCCAFLYVGDAVARLVGDLRPSGAPLGRPPSSGAGAAAAVRRRALALARARARLIGVCLKSGGVYLKSKAPLVDLGKSRQIKQGSV